MELLDFLPTGRPTAVVAVTRALAVDATRKPDGERIPLPTTELSMVFTETEYVVVRVCSVFLLCCVLLSACCVFYFLFISCSFLKSEAYISDKLPSGRT